MIFEPGKCAFDDFEFTQLIQLYFCVKLSMIFCVSSEELSLTTTTFFGNRDCETKESKV